MCLSSMYAGKQRLQQSVGGGTWQGEGALQWNLCIHNIPCRCMCIVDLKMPRIKRLQVTRFYCKLSSQAQMHKSHSLLNRYRLCVACLLLFSCVYSHKQHQKSRNVISCDANAIARYVTFPRILQWAQTTIILVSDFIITTQVSLFMIDRRCSAFCTQSSVEQLRG